MPPMCTPAAARPLALAAALALAALAPHAAASTWPDDVEHGLVLAGDNRAELENALVHYRAEGDPEKLAAAEFLIANMEGHGYIEHGFFDEAGNEVAFDALDYPRFKEAQAAFDALEKEHGTLDYHQKRFVSDLETMTAAYLIENVDLAFEAWRGRPWASGVSFDVFCEYVLPYRGSNEPLESWRRACMERLAGLTGELEDPHDLAAAARLVQRKANGWVGFSELYYLHPTDQGYAEMLEAKRGRCEDMSNMMGYAFRAAGVVAAQDYTPLWADRDNNHAWEVLLDADGHGRAGLSNRAAKIYRKTYSIQRDSLGAIRREDEAVPRWLKGKNYRDVTDDYLDTTDVTVALTDPVPQGARFAYLCVFNGGDWGAIHWARIDDGRATFTKMGRRVAYLPAYDVDDEIRPAAPPFILAEDGSVRILNGAAGGGEIAIRVAPERQPPDSTDRPAADTPDAPDDAIRVKPGARYELLVWEAGWRSLGTQPVDATPVTFEHVPANRLYWLVAEGSRRLERIFIMHDGARVGY